MVDESVLRELKQLLKSNRCSVENITEETPIQELEMDSVHLTAVLLEMEETFAVLVTDDVWSRWTTVGDAADYIVKYKEDYDGMKMKEL